MVVSAAKLAKMMPKVTAVYKIAGKVKSTTAGCQKWRNTGALVVVVKAMRCRYVFLVMVGSGWDTVLSSCGRNLFITDPRLCVLCLGMSSVLPLSATTVGACEDEGRKFGIYFDSSKPKIETTS